MALLPTTAPPTNSTSAGSRLAWYALTAGLLVLLSYLLSFVSWSGDAYFHRMTETAAGMIAVMIGIMALTRHYSRRDNHFLLMGTAFIGTGLLDVYHGILTSPGLIGYLSSALANVVPWSWLWSRVFLAAMLIVTWAVWRQEQRLGRTKPLAEPVVYALAATLMAASCLVFFVIPLPRANFPGRFFPRPQELVSGGVFLAALILHLYKGEWKTSRYEHWLIIGILIECLDHTVIMARSQQLHDAFFNAAHLVKPAGYLCVLAGLVINMYELFSRLEVSLAETERAGRLLLDAQHELEQRVQERTAQLDASQRFVTSVVEHLPNMVFVKDARDLRFVQFNKAGETLTGLSREELIGRTDFDLFPSEQAEFFTSVDRSVLAHMSLTEIQEERLQTRHQGTRILRTKKIPICDAQGRPEFLLGISEDITDAKKAEDALRRSEERFREMANTIPHVFWMAAHDLSEFLYVSPAIECLWGRPLGSLHMFGREWMDAIVPADRPRVLKAVGSLRDEGTPYEIEYRIHQSGGRIRWVLDKGYPVRDQNGRPQRHVGFIQDVTERRQAARARQTLQHAIDYGKDGLALLDAGGRYRYMNPAHAAMYGYRVEELLGKEWKELYHPDWVSLIEQLSKPDLIEQGNWQGEVVGRKKSGEPFHVEITLALIGEDNDDGATMVCTCRDISKRKRMERDLITAKDAAELGARAKAEFLATMSHEIRTPMNGVIGMTGLLLDTTLTTEQRTYAEMVRRSGESLLAIINDILDFSKIEAGKLGLEIIDFDLRTTVEETLDLLAEPAHRKHLELVGLIDAAVPTALRGDPGRLRQILTNLIGNAVKFTDRGEVVLKLSAEREEEGIAELRFEVVDTGIGIPPDSQDRLFQSFSQADGSTTRKFGGTGLGLAISKQLVELMGGHIGVESRPGEGSRFWFTVRLERQAHASTPVQPAEDLSRLHVCVIDDNATNRLLLEHHARSWGMTHASAEDGPRGLACLREASRVGRPFDLALIDMQMPNMDGLELARAIRADPSIAPLRLVLLTSLARRGDAKLARDSGFSAYLTKPIHQHQLYDCLRLVMGQTAAGSEDPDRFVTVHSLAEIESRSHDRILLAEDNAINQKVAVKMLEKLGYHVDVVANGEEAVEALSRIPYALVFMDCQMPEMDGFEATKRIRLAEGGRRHTPIIAMTANVMQGDRERCLAAGMDDYVSKPIATKDVKAALDRWLKSSAAASA